MAEGKIWEIRIRKTENLSKIAQKEVKEKLEKIMKDNPNYNYTGHCKVTIVMDNGKKRTDSVDPIEGNIINYFRKHTNAGDYDVFSDEYRIKEIENKAVKDRTTEEHVFLIKNKYKNNITNYLLSMGDFKEYDIPDDEVKPKDGLERYTLSDSMQLFRDKDRYYLIDHKFDKHDTIYIEFKEMKKLMDTVNLLDKRLVKVERTKGIVVKETYSDGSVKKKLVEDPVGYILKDEN